MNNSQTKYLNYLADYIKGNIKELKLKQEIEQELKNNEELRLEYENLRAIFSELEKSKAFNPPEYYFNNFLIRLNKKLGNTIIYKIKKFIFNWKFAISFSIIILIILFYQLIINTFQNKNIIQITLNDTSIKKMTEQTLDTSITNNEDVIDNEEPSTDFKTKKIDDKKVNKISSENFYNENIMEFLGDEEFIESHDVDSDLENEFEKLPQNEQQQILEKLENLKI
ncbi:MAG: hypothetical protein N2490_08665 [Ignavibacteria bacterium]|nr:hypothetical protein [Ignavibacteria bacterium]